MLLTVSLAMDDLAATRFAISALGETIAAVKLLPGVTSDPVNQPWLRWARAQLARRPIAMPLLWPLLNDGPPSRPEFLTPAPLTRTPSIDEELTQLLATTPETIRGSLHRVFGTPESSGGTSTWPDSARELAARPKPTLELIAEEIADLHDRLIAPHWERMRLVLDADITFRGGMLADAGIRGLFSTLHPEVRWSAGMLSLSNRWGGPVEHRVTLGPDRGLVLVPSVLAWPYTVVKLNASTQTTLRYPTRGVATVWEDMATAGVDVAASATPLRGLLGAPRARLLQSLRSPATTTGLARSLGVTPAAVSQHLAVLRKCGLVERTRSGREVLYEVSDLGLALLDNSSDTPGSGRHGILDIRAVRDSRGRSMSVRRGVRRNKRLLCTERPVVTAAGPQPTIARRLSLRESIVARTAVGS